MLRRLLLLLALLVSMPLLGSCYVSPGPGVRVHHGGRCRNECAYWGNRQQCDRFCRVWAGGVCMAWEQRCRPMRTCMRWESRCY